ncbi:short-chain dehydrogenase family protein [Radiomyces spectabilis]|uniref:short-chain dehydrogenase family protein n=1 Tax=Radiomyces spectabilis TaxID=64574 RepID=UPI00222104F7|nr:short-chain dehydrogenase family protein [Radiomyces spectabilis]KAI8379758.1 short-chain dehydrogenase family protein [Radiomyces spectabilis]
MAQNVNQVSSDFPGQTQNQPGLQHEMNPHPINYDMVGDEGKLEPYKAAGKLKGKKAIVTGGDSGIGRSVAFLFAKEGVDGLTIFYHPREEKDALDTKKDIEGNNKCQVETVGLDIGDVEQVKKAVQKHVDRFGTIDILVNNAGEQHIAEHFKDIPVEQMQRTFQTNILGMMYTTKFSLPHMKKGSAIVNTTSVTAYRGSAKLVDYSSTKGAIVAFTRSLSQQLAGQIRVNAVAPGPIWTPLIPASFTKEQVEQFGKSTAMGRAGQPVECATAYVFLAGPDASYFTGQVLHPNGGDIING